jgi:hypothetical protein
VSANTGNISLLLYLAFILIAFISTFILYRFLISNSLSSEKLDRLIDFFKTVVFTSALGTVALIVTNLFKERDQDIKELEYFDKYASEIKIVNGIGRLQLSKYFSIVAPSGSMKEAWKLYYQSVQNDYDDYIKAQEDLSKDTSAAINKAQSQIRKQNEQKIAQFESPLSLSNEKEELLIIVGGDKSLEAANVEKNKTLAISKRVEIIKKGNAYRTVILGLFSYEEAKLQLDLAKKTIDASAYIVRKKSWCNTIEMDKECLICR